MPEYRCPNHPEFVAESIGGWKNHRTRMDGGWDDADLAEATGASPSAESVRERMSRFAQTMPDSASGTTAPAEGTPLGDATVSSDVPPAPEVRRVRGTPKKLKKLFAQIPEVVFERNGITLDDEDKDAVEEAIEFLENIFGVEFQVPASKYVVESRFWAVLWPLGVILFILVKHKAEQIFAGVKFGQQPDNRHSGAEGNRQDT